jgi:uncharacterized damage-inducible protein DinB
MDFRYPIGQFETGQTITPEQRETFLREIAETPGKLRAAVSGLSDAQLDTPYRPGGWTVRQVVHHVPDSHVNSYMRFKLALTEDEPLIRTYHEERWAELEEARTAPIEVSLKFLDALHDRWVLFLRTIKGDELKRSFKHPEWGLVSVEQALGMYAWHGKHHVAHITALREREGWA